jgi:hypothetical protein
MGGVQDVDDLRLHRPLSDLAVRLTATMRGRISITPSALRPSENLINAAMAPSIARSSLRSTPIVALSKLVRLLPDPFFRLASDDALVFLASADMLPPGGAKFNLKKLKDGSQAAGEEFPFRLTRYRGPQLLI